MAKKISLKGKGCYQVYKATGRYEKNRKRRLERHLKAYPEDAVAKAALKTIEYRRYTPKTTGGWINRKDESFQKLTLGEARDLAQIRRNARKVVNELAYNRAYQKIVAAVAQEVKNQAARNEAKVANKPSQPAKPHAGKGKPHTGKVAPKASK